MADNLNLTVKLHRLVDIDDFASEPPFIKLADSATGESFSSASAALIKKSPNYKFDSEEPLNTIHFSPSGREVKLSVTVLSRDEESGQLIQYPGVGIITIDCGPSAPTRSGVSACRLLEDGDDMLEIGVLEYSYELIDENDAAMAAFDSALNSTQPEPNDSEIYTDGNANSSSFDFRPDTGARASMDDEVNLGTTVDQPENAQHDATEEENFLSKTEADRLVYTTTDDGDGGDGDDDELRVINESNSGVRANNNTSPQRDNFPVVGEEDMYDDPDLVTSDAGEGLGTVIDPNAEPTMDLRWARHEENMNPFIEKIHRDLTESGKMCSKVTVRLHSVIVSGSKAMTAVAAVAKVAVLPLPGKVITLRSAAAIKDDTVHLTASAESGNSESNTNVATTVYSFGRKSAVLSMGPGDLRSRSFKEGACPRLSVEVTFSGGSTGDKYTAYTALYLPALVGNHSGELLSIPLVHPYQCPQSYGEDDMGGDGDDFSSTLILELNPVNDAAGAGAGAVMVPDRTAVSASESSRGGVAARPQSTVVFNFNMLGLVGSGLDKYSKLPDGTVLQVALTGSGCQEEVAIDVGSKSGSIINIQQELTLQSRWPQVDMVQASLRLGAYPEDEVGRMFIPVSALLEMSSSDGSDPVVALPASMMKAGPASKTGPTVAFHSAHFKLICGADCVLMEPPEVEESEAAEAGAVVDAMTEEERQSRGYSPEPDRFSSADGGHNAGTNATPVHGTPVRPRTANGWMMTDGSPGRPTTTDCGPSAGRSNNGLASKSVGGQLLVGVQGFIAAGAGAGAGVDNSTFRSKAVTAGGWTGAPMPENFGSTPFPPPTALSKTDSVSIELTLLPEGQKKRTDPATPALLSVGDLAGLVQWGKTLQFPVTWKLLQRQVSGLKISVISEKPPNPRHKGSARVVLGTHILDMSTFVSYERFPVITFLLPIGNGFSSSSLKMPKESSLAGWALMALQFRPQDQSAHISSDLELLKSASQTAWQSLTAYPCRFCMGLNADRIAAEALVTRAEQVHPTKLTPCRVHVALGPVHFSGTHWVADLQNNQDESFLSCVIRSGNDMTQQASLVGMVHPVSGEVQWEGPDTVIKFTRERSVSPFVFIYLVRGRYPDATVAIEAARIIGESNLVLSNEDFRKGIPLNFTLPFRDAGGDRMAALTLSVQATAMSDETAAAAAADGGDTVGATGKSVIPSSPSGAVPLRIEFCEGNIFDPRQTAPVQQGQHPPDRVLEPFFECSIIPPEGTDLLVAPKLNTRARTGFLRVTQELDQWGLDCTVHVPPNLIPEPGSASTGNVRVNIGIVCRDASRQGCPELGWARLSLPLKNLVSRRRPLDQWVTLIPPEEASIQPANTNGAILEAPGRSRVKLRISADEVDYDEANAPFGVGAVMLRLISVVDPRAGVNDDIAHATAACFAWPAQRTATSNAGAAGFIDDDDGEGMTGMESAHSNEALMFSQVQTCPSNYINEMAMFNDDMLVGSVPVCGGFSDVKLDLRTVTTNAAYATSFPVMAATTKAASGEGALVPPAPVLTLSLTKSRKPAKANNGAPSSSASSQQLQRIEPKLQVEAIYVPYVTGKLVIHCSDVQLQTDLMGRQRTRQQDAGGRFHGALRYLLGNNSSRFVFSKPFDVPTNSHAATNARVAGAGAARVTGADSHSRAAASSLASRSRSHAYINGKTKTKGRGASKAGRHPSDTSILLSGSAGAATTAPSSLQHTKNVTFMQVDTFDLVRHGLQCNQGFALIPLFVNLLELEHPDTQFTAADLQYGQQACVGVGYVSTAALYYQALRAAASCHMDADQQKKMESSGNTPDAGQQSEGGTGAAGAAGAGADVPVLATSPWLTARVEVFNPRTKKRFATVTLQMQFVMESVVDHVAGMLQAALYRAPGTSNPAEKARAELGLKQSFMLADADRSGAVSSSEVWYDSMLES